MPRYYTVYRILNLVNGKYYIGVHQTDDLDDGYMGSGKLIRAAIEKYGLSNFRKEYLAVLSSAEEMFHLEGELVSEATLADPRCYNLKEGGIGGWQNLHRSEHAQEWRAKGGQTRGREIKPGTAEKLSASLKNRWARGEFAYLKPIMSDAFRGKSHTEETKRRIGAANSARQSGPGNSHYGTCWIHNLKLQRSQRIPKDSLSVFLADGWVKGRKMRFD